MGRAILLVVLAVAACAESGSEPCSEDIYCPAGTSCGAGGVCLVDQDSCGQFAEHAPCALGGEAGFCGEESCEPSVAITGRLNAYKSDEVLAGLNVEAVDRPWMQPSPTDAAGVFTADAVMADELTLRFTGDERLLPLHSRRLALSNRDYELNGDAAIALSSPTQEQLGDLERQLDLVLAAEHGILFVRVARRGTDPLNPVIGASVEIAGPSAGQRVHFDDKGARLDLATTGADGTAVFIGLEPGRYSVTVSHPQATAGCAGAGADSPDPIEADVFATAVTSSGWALCDTASGR